MSFTYISALNPIPHWIDGAQRELTSDRTAEVFDPAVGIVACHVQLAAEADVNAAVVSAEQAQHTWGGMAPQRRARVLFKMKELVERHTDDLARLITREQGKTFPDAQGEVQRGLEVIEFACGIPQLLKGQFSDNVGGEIANWSQRMPPGVTAGITPFNFPFMVPMWMAPVAIACGNSFIPKPSERDPSPSLLTAELFREAGLPDGDLGQAADALIGAAYGSAGERCMAISVAVVVGGIADELVEKVKTRAEKLNVNDGAADGADMGPVVSAQAKQCIVDYITSGVDQGAELRMDGRNLVVSGRESGFFLGATLFDRVTPNMTHGLAFLRRLEAESVRRPSQLRRRGRALLHALQEHYAALAG